MIARSLVGISKDGSKVYVWVKRMVWNTQYDINEHTLLTLDTSGKTTKEEKRREEERRRGEEEKRMGRDDEEQRKR